MVILGCAAAWFASAHWSTMQRISAYRNDGDGSQWWHPYTTKAGDLAKMAYLADVPKFRDTSKYRFRKTADTGRRNVNLYIAGDSYLLQVPADAFTGVNRYSYARRFHDVLEYERDSTKTNILILEISERYVQSYLSRRDMLKDVRKKGVVVKDTTDDKTIADRFNNIFRQNTDENLEYNLFNYQFLAPVRELKAILNYRLFGRASGDVVISDDGNYLFLRTITAPTGEESIYTPLRKTMIDTIVHHINTFRDHFRKEGFAEMYVAIIPNTPTLLQPGGYNGLIPMIYNHPSLKAPAIDIYSVLKQQAYPQQFFRAGDTHWNQHGAQLWIDMVNKELHRFNYPEANGVH